MSKTVSLTGVRLMEVRSGFLLMQSRALPANSDMRVSLMFAPLRPALEAYMRIVQKQQERLTEAEALEEGSLERRTLEAEIMGELERLASSTYDVPAPRRRLTVADLPVAIKTKDGQGAMNAAGRSQIATSLAPEFFDLDSFIDPEPADDDVAKGTD